MLLFEGVSYVLHLRSGFLGQLEDSQKGVLQEHWFRSSSSAIVTDYQKGAHIFKGNERQFSGLTIAPLDNMTGMPLPFAWKLKFHNGITTLDYQNSQGESWRISHWLGDEGHFQYMATDGKWYKKWPPIGSQLTQIPRIIMLSGKRRQIPFLWMVKLFDNNYTRIETRDDW